MDKKTIDAIRVMAMKAWSSIQEWATSPDGTGKSPLDRVGELVRNQVEDAKSAFSPEALKIAMCYEEKTFTVLSFKDLIAQVKKSYALRPGMRVCVLKTSCEISVLDIMVCDENNEIKFSPTCPWLRLVVADLDAELSVMFGNKSMLVLK